MAVAWYGDSVTRHIKGYVTANLVDALEEVKAEVVALVSAHGPPRSSPFDPPRKDTGELAGSFFVQGDPQGARARIGSTCKHAAALEQGTSRMQPRPFFLDTLLNNYHAVGRKLVK